MNWEAIESIATLAGTILAIVAALLAYKELKVGADNSRGEFILNLQQVYSDNEAYADLFEVCWHNYLGKLENEKLKEYILEHEKDVLNYMTFFESVYLMLDRRVLNLKLLDELFGRRFFIVVNNRVVQDCDLVVNKPYYENVFLLFDRWKEYRIQNNNMDFIDENVLKTKGYCDLKSAYLEYREKKKRIV